MRVRVRAIMREHFVALPRDTQNSQDVAITAAVHTSTPQRCICASLTVRMSE